MTTVVEASQGTGRTSRVRRVLEVRSLPDTPSWLVVASIIFLKPNIAGETQILVGFALIVAAATIELVRRCSTPLDPDESSRAMNVVGGLVLAAYLAVIVKSLLIDPLSFLTIALQDLVLTAGTTVAFVVVAQNRRSRTQIARGFVLLVALACASYAVTAFMWAGLGLGFGEVTRVTVGNFGTQSVFFPFTTTSETQEVLGLEFPRFVGFGREPGWMAMYCAAAFFLADAAGLRHRLLKPVLLLGLLGCVSTAGFGVFVVVWAFDRTLRPRGGITLVNYGRQIVGLVTVPVALWLATDAPVLGLSAKKTQNGQSLNDREDAIAAGLRALTSQPWGGRGTAAQSGINLVSDVAVDGIVFVVLVIAALLVPVAMQRRVGRGSCVAFVVFLTLLLSQPAFSSVWAFCLVAVAIGCDGTTSTDLVRLGHRRRRERLEHRPIGPMSGSAHQGGER